MVGKDLQQQQVHYDSFCCAVGWTRHSHNYEKGVFLTTTSFTDLFIPIWLTFNAIGLDKQSYCFQQSEDSGLMHVNHIWLVNADQPEILFGNLMLPINSQVLTFSTQKDGDTVDIVETYRIANSQPQQSRTIGNWTLEDGLFFAQDNPWQRRKNLNGLTFSAATLQVK